MDNKHNSLNLAVKIIMLRYLSLDIICLIMSADKYLSIFLHQMKAIVGTKSWMAAIIIFVSFIREYCDYLVLSSNNCLKKDKMKRENNRIGLPLEIWCSLSVPQCRVSNDGNWNSLCLYWFAKHLSPRFQAIKQQFAYWVIISDESWINSHLV